MIITEHNVETGEITERNMTTDEIKNIEELQKQAIILENEKHIRKAALLDRLGITKEEAVLLLA